jgi:hypothetical protein
MTWPHRLWQEVAPHLPAGRVGIWAPEESFVLPLPAPEGCLLEYHNLNSPTLPQGSAYETLLVIAGGEPVLPWADFLAQLAPLAAPNAPLLLVAPRTGLVALHQAGWENAMTNKAWKEVLTQSGWPVFTTTLLGGCAWPHAWATAACRLYVARRKGSGGLPTKVQFKRKASGTGAGSAATTGPTVC